MSEIGKVLWFDIKKGYGFVKVLNSESELFEKELFVHYSEIQCVNSFKILYPGETVSMNVEKNTEEGKEYLVSNVTGIYGSPLMIDNEKYVFKVIRRSPRGDESGDAEESSDQVEENN